MRARLPLYLAGAALLEFWLELAVLVPAGTPYRGPVAILLAVVVGALYAGRRHPLASVLAVFGVMALLPVFSDVYYAELVLPFASPFFAAYQLGMYASRRAVWVGVVAATPLSLAATMPNDQSAVLASGLFSVFVALYAPVLVARLLRNRLALNRALREKAVQLERRRADAAGRAVLDERTRIAGELHDVVAHALSAMTVQATGARRLTLNRPALALDAFAAIETAGREALDELRRLLGVLRREDAELTLAPQPSLRHVRSLTRRVSSSGLPVTLRVEDEQELPAGVDLTAYRVIQDALEAAREHGGAGRAEVRVRYRAEALELEVRDDGRSPAQRELIGVRERVLLHGGRFTAGPRRGGGHVVRATLPLDGQPVAEPAETPCLAEATLRRLRTGPPRRAEASAPAAAAGRRRRTRRRARRDRRDDRGRARARPVRAARAEPARGRRVRRAARVAAQSAPGRSGRDARGRADDGAHADVGPVAVRPVRGDPRAHLRGRRAPRRARGLRGAGPRRRRPADRAWRRCPTASSATTSSPPRSASARGSPGGSCARAPASPPNCTRPPRGSPRPTRRSGGSRPSTSGDGSPASCTTSSRTRSASWSSRRAARGGSSTAIPPARWRPRPGSSAPAARR